MRDDLSPAARWFMHASGSILSGLGAAMWVLGWCSTFALGMRFCELKMSPPTWSMLINMGFLLASVIVQLVGSAMYFLTKSWIADHPDQIPTEILPKWWLAKFSAPLCAELFATFLIAFIYGAIQLSPLAILYGLISGAAFKGAFYSRRQIERLSPPYPPRSAPPKWETRG